MTNDSISSLRSQLDGAAKTGQPRDDASERLFDRDHHIRCGNDPTAPSKPKSRDVALEPVGKAYAANSGRINIS